MIPQYLQMNQSLTVDTNHQPDLSNANEEAPSHLEAVAALRKATESVYQIILEKQPNGYRAPLNLGYLARQRGDSEAALKYFETARAASPHRTRPKLEMAQELRTLSRLDEAEALYLEVLAKQPKLVRALTSLGNIARTRNDHRKALHYYKAALAEEPDRTDLKLKVAGQLRKLLRIREAEVAYRNILNDEPDHPGIRERLRRLPKPATSELPPMDKAWLQRETFSRAAEWGRNLEAWGGLAFEMTPLVLAEDFAHGAREEVKNDCILIHLGKKTKLLPLVSSLDEYQRVLKREARTLASGNRLGPVSISQGSNLAKALGISKSSQEYVWRQETVSGLIGSALQGHRRNIRKLLKAGVRVEPISPDDLDRVLACSERWFSAKKAKGETTYFQKRTIWSLENLLALEPLGVRHMAVKLDDDVIGYTVGSYLGISWATYVYGRGDHEYDVGPLIVHECAKLYPEREWINAGDVGHSQGLAAFKEKFITGAETKQIMSGWIRA